MYRLKFNFTEIGDQVCTTAIPENIFNVTGEKCVIDDDRIWAFKHNPYVEFMSPEDTKDMEFINLWPDARIQAQAQKYLDVMRCPITGSQTEYMCVNLGFNDVKLRHPRLYIHENEKINPKKIVVHTTGSDRTKRGEPVAFRSQVGEDDVRVMTDDEIETILKNYEDYEIIQIGGADDKPLGGHSVNLCNKLDYWEVAKEIASSAIFIGIVSGPMHIANCFPRVTKKIILQEFPVESILTWRPGDVRNFSFTWFDVNNVYYNKFDHDVGMTFSYKKI